MTRRAILLPRWAQPLDGPLPATFLEWARAGETLRLHPLSQGAEPLSFVGLDPQRFSASEGALRVAAARVVPPSRSLHFALSLLAYRDGKTARPASPPTPTELASVLATLAKLNTPRLTLLSLEGLEHALVWDAGSLDHQTTAPETVVGSDPYRHLPQGDGEPTLRRYIDDSINLLSDLEANRVRQSEGHLPINLAWPWGGGFRPELPQLALLRGEALPYATSDPRLRGVCNLVGYRTVDTLDRSDSGATVLPAAEDEEAQERLSHMIERQLCALTAPFRLLVLFTGNEGGVGLLYDSERPSDNPSGWHSELIHDERKSLTAAHEAIAEFFA